MNIEVYIETGQKSITNLYPIFIEWKKIYIEIYIKPISLRCNLVGGGYDRISSATLTSPLLWCSG